MKPDEALLGEMEDAEVAPGDLFCKLGMLVVESRVPDVSPKGRIQGPHCPTNPNHDQQSHVCNMADFMCQRVEPLQRQMISLWKNGVPMSIEVLLYTNCSHGYQQATSLDFTQLPKRNDCILLEQWTIQALPRRAGEAVVRPRELFQAVKSYLYFSQLSAWLNKSHGKQPRNVAYRISPPGEFCTSSFTMIPEWHSFPLCGVSKALSIRVTAGSLPRHPDVIWVPCLTQYEECAAGREKGVQQDEDDHRACKPPSQPPEDTPHRRSPKLVGAVGGFDSVATGRKSPPERMMKPDRQKSLSPTELPNKTSMQPTMLYQMRLETAPSKDLAPFIQPLTHDAISMQKESGAIPKRIVPKKSSSPPAWYTDPYGQHSTVLDGKSVPAKPKALADSPKVLLTKKSPTIAFYQREEPWWGKNLASRDSTDSDQSSPEIDRYLRDLHSQVDPLSPEEIQSYLANLSVHNHKRSKDVSPLARTPSPGGAPVPSLTKVPSLPPQCLQDKLMAEYRDTNNSNNVEAKPKQDHQKSFKLSNQIDQSSIKDQTDTSPGVKHKITEASVPDEAKLEVQNGHRKKSPVRPMSPLTKQLQLQGKQETNGVHKEEATLHDEGEKVQFSIGEGEDEEVNVENGTSDTMHVSDRTASSPTQDRPVTARRPFPKSKSYGGDVPGFTGFTKTKSLLKSVIKKDLNNTPKLEDNSAVDGQGRPIPSSQQKNTFRRSMDNSANMIFHCATGLPLQSSPAPIKKRASGCFDFDCSLTNVRAIKSSVSCVNLDKQDKDKETDENKSPQRFYSTSAPASTNSLLGSFEESILNGRIDPSGVVEGFTADIGASGAFCPKHVTLPVTAYFFNISEDNAPSPYLGHINMESLGKRGYHIPKKGTVQVTLFNPNKTVVKMFVVMYDMSTMPANCQTFLRQRTLYMPVKGGPSDHPEEPVYLRYLIHLRFASSKSGKIYLHTDIRVIFARDKIEFDSRVANYELRSFTEAPVNPTFSPRR